jgi:hypothetical protein
MCEIFSVHLRKVGGLSPNILYNVPGFFRPPIKTDSHHITNNFEYGKNAKQINKQSFARGPMIAYFLFSFFH